MAATAINNLFLILVLMIAIIKSSLAQENSTQFIKTSCNTTSFPNLCFTSLSKFSASINQNPLQLALFATKSSLSVLKSASNTTNILYQKIMSSANKDTNTAKALKDCKDLLEDAVENAEYSLSELKEMKGAAKRSQMMWELSNAQTYMSAALTKEDTCTDGLNEMGAVNVKQVSGRVVKAKMYTSNALGLVNALRYTF